MNKTSGLPFVTPEQPPKTPTSLPVRNMASEEPQELRRSQATEAERDADTKKFAMSAKFKSESETLTDVKDTSRPEREESLPKGSASKWNARDENKINHSIDPTTSVIAPGGTEDDTSGSEHSNWEQEEDRLEAKAQNQLNHSHLDPNCPPQDQTTITTTTKTTSLLAGGTHGFVLPGQTTQRGPSAAATTLRTFKSHIHKADAMYHHTLEAHLHQDTVEQAAMRVEAEADVADDAAMRMIGPDVIKKHLLKDGKLERETSIGSFLAN